MTQNNVFDVVIHIPVGPPNPRQLTCHVIDTIESIKYYVSPNHQIVIMDDSKEANLGQELKQVFPDLDILRTSSPYGGTTGEFYIKCAHSWQYIHDTYKYQVLLDMDCDALITGCRPENDAIAFFEKHPKVGNLGLFKSTPSGKTNDLSWPARRIRIEKSYISRVFHREFQAHMSDLYHQAKTNGFRPGYHSIGCAQFIKPELVAKMSEMGLLTDQAILRFSRLNDDHLIGLMTYIAGFEISEFSGPDDIMALQWQGLPMSPNELAKRGKKIVHSTRYWNDMDEATIRKFFRKQRQKILS